jgi:hypothetical protein
LAGKPRARRLPIPGLSGAILALFPLFFTLPVGWSVFWLEIFPDWFAFLQTSCLLERILA